MHEGTNDGQTVCQTTNPTERAPGRPRASARQPITPAFLNARQAAQMLGVSERKFAALRRAGLVPPALELGPRALRWRRDELLEHVGAAAPRVHVLNEPVHLRGKRGAK